MPRDEGNPLPVKIPSGWQDSLPAMDPEVAVRQHRGLGHRAAGRAIAAGLDPDDVEQVVSIALWISAVTWRPEHGAWSTWATHRISWALIREVAVRGRVVCLPVGRRGPSAQSLDERLSHDDTRTPMDVLADQTPGPERRAAAREALARIAARLSEAELDVVVTRDLGGLTLDEVAARLGCCRERVRQIEVKARSRARQVAVRRPRDCAPGTTYAHTT